MPALKVHVRPPHRHKGLYMLGVVYGFACGGLFVVSAIEAEPVFDWLARNIRVMGYMQAVMVISICAFMAPLVPCAAYMSRSCQHNRPVYFAGQLVGSSYAFGCFVTMCLLEGPPPPDQGFYWTFAGVMVGLGVAIGLLGLLFSALYVNFVSVLLEQDGTLCVKCGYCVAHVPSDRCPECGVSKDTPIRSLGRIYACAELLARHSGKAKYSFGALVVCVASALAWHHMPVWRFSHRFKTDDSVVQSDYHSPAGRQDEYEDDSLNISRPIANEAKGRVLIVQFYRRGRFGSPRLQVRIGQVIVMPGGANSSYRYLLDGVPRVVCELDVRQTELAMDDGIPETLVHALIDAADEAGWVPLGPGVTGKPDVVVSADGHFPALENGEE